MTETETKTELTLARDNINAALARLEACEADHQVHQRTENANARDIEKLKRHVAELQRAKPRETIPAHDTHEDGL